MLGRTEPVSVRDLARFQQLPGRFLAKLFTRLEGAGIVDGIEGIGGGFSLARPPGQCSKDGPSPRGAAAKSPSPEAGLEEKRP